MAGVLGAVADSSNIGAGRQHAVAASAAAHEDPKTDIDIEGAERSQREVPSLFESLAGLEQRDQGLSSLSIDHVQVYIAAGGVVPNKTQWVGDASIVALVLVHVHAVARLERHVFKFFCNVLRSDVI